MLGNIDQPKKVMNNFCEVFENIIMSFCYELFGHFRTFTSKSSFEPLISRVGRGGGTQTLLVRTLKKTFLCMSLRKKPFQSLRDLGKSTYIYSNFIVIDYDRNTEF